MTDDFQLFAHADDPPVDADIALLTAYLARELSPVQIVAVEDRLSTDITFRDKAAPIIRAWLVRSPLGTPSTVLPVPDSGDPAPAEIEARWQRHLAELRREGEPSAPADRPQTLSSNRNWRRPMIRIAAVVTAIILPLIAVAQVTVYVAHHPGALGHALAQRIMSSRADASPKGEPLPGHAAEPRGPERIADAVPGSSLWQRFMAMNSVDQRAQEHQAHLLGPVIARSSYTLGSAAQLVALSDGRIMVSDPVRRFVQIFDASLANPKVVLDSTMAQPNTFSSGIGEPVVGGGAGGGGRSGGAATPNPRGTGPKPYLLPFRGDSSLWFDPVSAVFTVIDPSGKIIRALPTPPFRSITHSPLPSMPVSSARFGLVYVITPIGDPDGAPRWTGPDTVFAIEAREDSLFAVRYNLDTRVLDTLGTLTEGGGMLHGWRSGERFYTDIGPVPESVRFVDAVVAASDGSIVVLRSREYRLDWITPDGARTSQKLAYPWRRISDEMRKHLVDSILTPFSFNDHCGRSNSTWAADSARLGRVEVNAALTVRPCTRDVVKNPVPAAMDRIDPRDLGVRQNGVSTNPFVPAGDGWRLGVPAPDYFSPVPLKDALRADADGNVWIRQVLPPPGDPGYNVWDIVSRTKGVIDRVRIPETRTLIGFGPGGIVYLAAYDGGAARLEKVRVK